MKKLIIPVLLIALAFSQSCKDKNTSTEENSTNQEVAPTPADESQKQEIDSTTIILNNYKPRVQDNVPIEDTDSYSRKHILIDGKSGENYFKIEEDLIRVVIPNSDKDMKIMNVFNVSDYSNNKDYNAIVINIWNGKKARTANTVTHKLKADLKISKIQGLSKEKLKSGNLKVYILNEDIVDDKEKDNLKKCASTEQIYGYKECDLVCGILFESQTDPNGVNCKEKNANLIQPREQEGDIITGG